jgi:ABC-2 type transport system permease protein
VILALLGRQLRHQRWLLIGLAILLVGFEILLIHLAAAFEAGPGMEQMMTMLPEFAQKILASKIRTASFPGFVGFGFAHPAAMVACTGLVVLAATTPSGDRDAGVLDLLLARPVPRWKYLAACLANLALPALLLPACILLGCALGLGQVEVETELPWTSYVASALALSSLLLALGGLALLTGVISRRRGTAVARITAALLVTYVLDSVAQFSSLLGDLKWLSPFHYFHPIQAATYTDGTAGTATDSLVLLGIFVVATALAFRRFQTSDL